MAEGDMSLQDLYFKLHYAIVTERPQGEFEFHLSYEDCSLLKEHEGTAKEYLGIEVVPDEFVPEGQIKIVRRLVTA
jgi:hypothetical protein